MQTAHYIREVEVVNAIDAEKKANLEIDNTYYANDRTTHYTTRVLQ